MSSVELYVYDLLKNREHEHLSRFAIYSSTSGSGIDIAHLSIVVNNSDEYEYGTNGIISFVELVRINLYNLI